MKCFVCHSDDITKRDVMEHISHDNDIVCVPLNVLVCNACGERYYDRDAMHELEQAKESISNPQTHFSIVGRVLLKEDAAEILRQTTH